MSLQLVASYNRCFSSLLHFTAMVLAREDGFATDVSLNIQLFFKQNHLDYYIWVHFFQKERTWGKYFTIRSIQNRLNQAYITQNLEIYIDAGTGNHWRKTWSAELWKTPAFSYAHTEQVGLSHITITTPDKIPKNIDTNNWWFYSERSS